MGLTPLCNTYYKTLLTISNYTSILTRMTPTLAIDRGLVTTSLTDNVKYVESHAYQISIFYCDYHHFSITKLNCTGKTT
jgi:hypothetical protein